MDLDTSDLDEMERELGTRVTSERLRRLRFALEGKPMSMTTRQFNEIIDMLLGRVPLDMLDSKQQEGVTRVFVAAGFLMKHRLKLPEETPYSPTQAEVVAFLDGLNGTQMRKLKKIAEGVIPDGETSASVH
jgi:hypothetical protein